MSVLLPAPFSPTRAWTCPRSRVKSTSFRAVTPAKVLVIPRIRSSGSVGIIEEFQGVAGVEKSVFQEDAVRHAPPGQVALEGVEGQGAEAGVRLDAGPQLAAEDRLQRRALPVDGHQHH